MFRKKSLFFLLLTGILLTYCTRQTEEFTDPTFAQERLSEMLPLQKGKYITYRLDSLVFTKLGTQREIRRYQVRYVVDTTIRDNQGNTSYRIYRYINDSLGKGAWVPAGTSFITPFSDRVEAVEDNLRSIVLALPVQDGYSWKGNRYVGNEPYGLWFTNMNEWEFTYGEPMTEKIGNRMLDSVLTVYKVNETLNAFYDRPIVDTQIALNITAMDKYAKNIGLVYKEQTLWEHQNDFSITINPVTRDTVKSYRPYSYGFGIRMWMIDHN